MSPAKNVIIADDHPLFRTALREALRPVLPDARVNEADSFPALQSLLQAGGPPDLVLLDLNMPDMDGFAVVRQLRERFGHRLTVAAMTGYGRQGDRRATRETGFDAHLTKPVGLAQLQRVLARRDGAPTPDASA